MKISIEFSLSKEDRELVRSLMSLTDDLKATVAGLTTSVDNLAARQPVTVPPPVLGGSVADSDVFQAITDVKTQTARIDTLVNPNPVQVPAQPASSGPTLVPATDAPATTDFANPLTP